MAKRLKTNYQFEDTNGKAIQLVSLVSQKPEMNERLPAGLMDRMSSDLQTAAGKRTKALKARDERISLTTSQSRSLVRGNKLVVAGRKTMRVHYGAQPEVLDRFSVNRKLNSRSVSSVSGCLESLLSACKSEPEIARNAGIFPQDVSEMEVTLAELTSINSSQETKKMDAKVATSEKTAAQVRIEEAMAKIDAVASVVFRDDPETLALFAACRPGSRRSAKGTKKEKTETPAAPK
jgi:hypothetical protein